MKYIDTTDDKVYILEISDDMARPNTFKIRRFIFQDVEGLNKALDCLTLQTLTERLKIESVREMNVYLRFVRLKDTPTWILLTIGEAIRKAKNEIIMDKNHML